MLNVAAEATIKGRQNLQVLVNGEVVRETGFHKNMVLNSWFAGLVNGTARGDSISYNHVAVGTGTTAVSATQTGLANYLTKKEVADSVTHAVLADSGDNSVYRTTRTWTFAESAVIGNITEVATYALASGSVNSSTVAHTRALVLDVNGDPSSIALSTGEQLRVVHELELGVSNLMTTTTQDMTTGGSTVNYTIQLQRTNKTENMLRTLFFANSNIFALLTPFASFTTFSFSASNGPVTTTGAVNYTSACTLSLENPLKIKSAITLNSAVGNVAGGTEGIVLTATSPSQCLYGIKFTPKLPKNSLNKLTFDFSLEFVRV